MFKGFNRHEILKAHYAREIESWFPLTLEHYEPECADDLDEFHYKAAWIGTNPAPSGKVYAPWTTNQTRHDVERDEAWSEAIEEIFERKGGFADWFSGDLFFVKRFANPEIPPEIRRLTSQLNFDLHYGPLYLDSDGEQCSCFDEGARQFDFARASDTVREWFDSNSPSEDFTTSALGDELARAI
jgi:hypothetical protein